MNRKELQVSELKAFIWLNSMEKDINRVAYEEYGSLKRILNEDREILEILLKVKELKDLIRIDILGCDK